MKAILVRVGAEPEVIDLPENQDAAFTAMRALVGGYLERFRFFNGDIYCDEDGNPKNLAPNRLGLVGDFVIVGPARIDIVGHIVGLTPEKIEWNLKHFARRSG